MKVGDQLPVYVDSMRVGYAILEETSGSEATIFIPAQRVVVGLKFSLTQKEFTESKETLILGVENENDSDD